MTTHREYDSANRLRLIESRTNGVAVCSFTYDYNLAGQRTRVTTAPQPSHWDYTYDALGQVTSGRKRWSDSNWVAGAQFNYGFDTIGNRLWTEAGGDSAGTGLRHAAYTNNLLNQITARDVPGAADVTGSAHPQVTVTVNGSTANRHSDYYHQVLTWNNATGAVWAAITNRAQCQGLSDTSTGHLLLPQTPETFRYDQDGNLLQDGLWNYTWDAENRLTRMVSRADTPSASWQALDFCYDWLGRRVGKVVSRWNEANQAYEPSGLRIYCYAGWNLQVEVDETGDPARSFTWGTDASGTPQGAGGVGGLLSMTIHRGTNAGTYFYCYDGNWNVVALVNAATGEVAAQYEYGPFHELLRATGPVARENPFLAATKYYDWETGLYYYGYRYYAASTGRWLTRDPQGEAGGANQYGFVANDPNRSVDLLGLGLIAFNLAFVSETNIAADDPPVRDYISRNENAFRDILKKCKTLRARYDKPCCRTPYNDWTAEDMDNVYFMFFYVANLHIRPGGTRAVWSIARSAAASGADDRTAIADAFGEIGELGCRGIPTIVTDLGIQTIDSTGTHAALGITMTSENGIMVQNTRRRRGRYTLAHELGHVMRYVGPIDGTHDDRRENIMHPWAGGEYPDCQYCELLKSFGDKWDYGF